MLSSINFASLFSGGGCIESAVIDQKTRLILAVEGDPERPELSSAIADVYEINYGSGHLVRSPVENVDFNRYAIGCDVLHASPSCKNFSVANVGAVESRNDIKAAEAVCRAITALQPAIFTLEQVRGYINTHSFSLIINHLVNCGYGITYEVLNSYFYGVPQERERVFITASRSGKLLGFPAPQPPTSWGEVLKDRIPHMEPISPTAKEKEALGNLPLMYPRCKAFLIQRRGQRMRLPTVKQYYQPAPVVTCAMFTDGRGGNRQSFFDVALQDGGWYTLSMRDMARLQTLPDWYKLPEKTSIAGAVVGNGVPTNMYKAIYAHVLEMEFGILL